MIAEMIGRGIRSRQSLDGIQFPGRWLVDWASGGEPTSSGEAINEQNALNCPAVKAAVSLLSESLALSSIEICQQTDPDTVVVVKDHDLVPLLNRQPNPETNSMTWWDMMQNHHGTWGNAYAYIQRTVRGNKTIALWNRKANPERTKPVRSKDDGKLYYQCHNANGQLEAMVPAADMLHVRYLSLDGILGKSPVRMIRETIGGNKAAERIANEVFANGDATQGHYIHPGKLSEAAYARLKKSLAEGAEHGERHRKKILEEGMKFEGTSYNLSEMQMIEARQYLDVVVAMAYNIDAQLLQMRVNGVLPLPDLMRKFVSLTLALWGERWTAEINSKLLQPPFFCRWNFSVFLRNDRTGQSQEHRTNFAVGKQSVNEMRHERGDNRLEIPEADEHFVPMNMVPLSMAAEVAKALVAKAKMPTGNPTGGDNSEAPPGMPPGGGDGVQPGDANGQDGGRPEGGGGKDAGLNRLGGPGSGPHPGGGEKAEEKKGREPAEEKPNDRAARAKASYNPSTAEKQRESDKFEAKVANAIGAKRSDDNRPLDNFVDEKHGVELKVMHNQKPDGKSPGRVNMRPDSRARKEAWAAAEKGRDVHTVLIDNRDKFADGAHAEKYSGHHIYYAPGVGAFRMEKMTKVKNYADLKQIIKGDPETKKKYGIP